MPFTDSDVHDIAQGALDQYNGGYGASDINMNATVYLYRLRDTGNSDMALAVASHYLHCRWITSYAWIPGLGAGIAAVYSYDGAVKFIDTLVKKYSSQQLVHQFGKAPTSTFSTSMIAWDLQGLLDGMSDFMFEWGTRPFMLRSMHGQTFLNLARAG